MSELASNSTRSPPEIYLSAPAVVLPGRRVDNEEVIERVRANFRGSASQWRRIERKIRFAFDMSGSQYRWLDDESPQQSAAAYAADAARSCLAEQAVDAEDVDAVIFGAVCREYFEPATAFEVAARAGIHRPRIAFDVSNACSGFLTATQVFAGLSAIDPQLSTGLVCAAEGSGRREQGQSWVSYDIQRSTDLDLLAAGLTIGNAAAAALVSTRPPAWGARIVGMETAARPDHYELSVAHVNGVFECDSSGLFRETADYQPHIMALLDRLGWAPRDLDYICIHQPSERVITTLGQKFGATLDQLPLVHRYYGNTVSLSPIVPLHHLLEERKVEPGMKIVLTAAAAGITMNSIALEWCPDRRAAAPGG